MFYATFGGKCGAMSWEDQPKFSQVQVQLIIQEN